MASDEQIEILRGPLAGGVPPSALGVYGRWWQLETYLREVAYTELRAAFGASWADHVGGAATTRAERDQINAYMASADADEPLAYADASVLFALIKSMMGWWTSCCRSATAAPTAGAPIATTWPVWSRACGISNQVRESSIAPTPRPSGYGPARKTRWSTPGWARATRAPSDWSTTAKSNTTSVSA